MNYIKQFMEDNNLKIGEEFIIDDINYIDSYKFDDDYILCGRYCVNNRWDSQRKAVLVDLLSGRIQIEKIQKPVKIEPINDKKIMSEMYLISKINEIIEYINQQEVEKE